MQKWTTQTRSFSKHLNFFESVKYKYVFVSVKVGGKIKKSRSELIRGYASQHFKCFQLNARHATNGTFKKSSFHKPKGIGGPVFKSKISLRDLPDLNGLGFTGWFWKRDPNSLWFMEGRLFKGSLFCMAGVQLEAFKEFPKKWIAKESPILKFPNLKNFRGGPCPSFATKYGTADSVPVASYHHACSQKSGQPLK